MNSTITVIWLKSLKGFGNRTIQKLYDATSGKLNLLWHMKESDLKSLKTLTTMQITELLNGRHQQPFEEHMELCRQRGIVIVTQWDHDEAKPCYPNALKHIYDCPVLLYMKGDFDLLKKHSVGIVGTRNPTEQGLKTAKQFAGVFSKQDIVVVSGMAEGIDAAAHMGAINNCGGTIAVLGSGIDQPYPAINKGIYNDLCDKGLVISEYPPGTEPQKGYFSKRNRIISGLSEAIVVIEASWRSGALITANYALDQGKNIYAVPGSVYSSRYEGCHNLIRQGGQLVTKAQDVLDDLSVMVAWDIRDSNDEARNENACYHGLYGVIWKLVQEREPIVLEELLKEVKTDRETVFQYTMDLMLDGVVERGLDGAFRVGRK